MKKFRLFVILPGILLILGALVAYRVIQTIVNTIPLNSPETCSQLGARHKPPLVLVTGDSLTLGRISADYVGLLQIRNQGRLRFSNAGVNGDQAAMARNRLGPALDRCQPRALLVLIGTNDVNNLAGETEPASVDSALFSIENPDSFRSSLRAMLRRARAAGVERVGVFTIPPIGEDLATPANDRVRRANTVLALEAGAADARILPLYERMSQILEQRTPRTTCAGGRAYVEVAAFQYYLFGRSWNEISDSLGFALSTDCMHLNDRAALLMAGLAESFLADL